MKGKEMVTSGCIVVIQIIITLGLLITLPSLVLHWRTTRNAVLMPKEPYICERTYDTAAILEGITCNSSQCCRTASQILNYVSKKCMLKRYDGNPRPAFSTYMQNCHKTIRQPNKLFLQDIGTFAVPNINRARKVYWKDPDNVQSGSGLKYLSDDGSIFIERPGLYYISSQLTHWIENKTSDSPDLYGAETLDHFVILISHTKREEKVILQNKRSPCSLCAEESTLTSSMGAVFQLERRDRIYVASSHAQNLFTETNSFLVYSLLD